MDLIIVGLQINANNPSSRVSVCESTMFRDSVDVANRSIYHSTSDKFISLSVTKRLIGSVNCTNFDEQ